VLPGGYKGSTPDKNIVEGLAVVVFTTLELLSSVGIVIGCPPFTLAVYTNVPGKFLPPNIILSLFIFSCVNDDDAK
jgi:hypothetical protein